MVDARICAGFGAAEVEGPVARTFNQHRASLFQASTNGYNGKSKVIVPCMTDSEIIFLNHTSLTHERAGHIIIH